MAVKTQGTTLFFYDKATKAIVDVGCVRDLNVGGSPADPIDVTCLEDNTRKYVSGLKTPGQVTFTLLTDPQNGAHKALFDLSEADDNENVKFFIGWRDGNKGIKPAVSGEAITLPDTRTWLTFEGHVSDFPFDFAGNEVVQTPVAIQISGERDWAVKSEVSSTND